jgi:hypothetical protein
MMINQTMTKTSLILHYENDAVSLILASAGLSAHKLQYHLLTFFTKYDG